MGSLCRLVSSIAGVFILGAIASPGEEAPPFPELELASGETLAGAVTLGAGTIGIATTPGQAPRQIGLGDLARLTIPEPPEPAEVQEKPPGGGKLPEGWKHADVGRLVKRGTARWSDHQFILQASKRVEGEEFSAFHLAYFPVKGEEVELVARVVKVGDRNWDSYGGIVMAGGPQTSDPRVVLSVNDAVPGRVNFRRWSGRGGSSSGITDPKIKLPYWLKLVRKGADVNAYYSDDGRRWQFLKTALGRIRTEEFYIGVAARVAGDGDPGETVIDHVRLNGTGSQPEPRVLPRVVLTAGSVLAAEVERADITSFKLGGRWGGLKLTTPRVARVEFFHPLPADVEDRLSGQDPGLVLRDGDFYEGKFVSLDGGIAEMSSILFGARQFSVAEEADALVLRKVYPPAAKPAWRVETHAGSELLAQEATLAGGKLQLEVAGLGAVVLELSELRLLETVPAP